jgi:short-subunit dehydrogenase
MDRRLCLITGASAGIGAEFARQYAALGWDVALTARRADRLDALAAELQEKYRITAIVIAEDLAKKSAPAKILAALEEKGRHVDALVNNAGYGLPGTFFSTSWKEQGDFIQVLYTAPIELAHRVLPGMAERGYGRIINVASLAGYAAGSAGHTLYASVKAGMIKFSESLNAECEASAMRTSTAPRFAPASPGASSMTPMARASRPTRCRNGCGWTQNRSSGRASRP